MDEDSRRTDPERGEVDELTQVPWEHMKTCEDTTQCTATNSTA